MESQNNVAAGTQLSTPDARDDLDVITVVPTPGPTSGNAITGAGTVTGESGADTVGTPPAQIVEVQGSAGGDTAGADGSMQATGRFGVLEIDAQGDFTYTPNQAATPVAGAQDVFRYTLANAEGQRDAANLTIQFQGEQEEQVVAQVTGADGVVFLPAGVELSDIRVVGRDLVITLPDGSQMVIPNGAIFVPQLVIGDVEVPPTNVAALLISLEPQPAAGIPQSSGGNFSVDVPPLDPGVALGDLLPPTEFGYTPPVFEEAGNFIDREPEVLIQPDGEPASANAVDRVDEAGLGTRGAEPAGTRQESDAETTTGVILIDSPDAPSAVTINGVPVTGVGQVIDGAYGTLEIISISGSQIDYRYTLDDNINHSTQPDEDVFTVTVTDNDGDQDTATLTIDILDDGPIARPDTDSIAAGQFGPATGNVMTDAAPGDIGDSDTDAADTVGADDATLTSVSGAGGSDSSFSEGVLQVRGEYGVLTIDAQGNYSYVRDPGTPGGVSDVFNYTLTDGDGTTSSSTLTITIADQPPVLQAPAVVQLDDDALPGGNPGGTGDDPDSVNTSGTLVATAGDGDIDFAFSASQDGLPAGFTANQVDASTLQILQGGTVVLTVTLNNETGAYSVVQNNPIDHPAGDQENNISNIAVGIVATDVDGDVSNEVDLVIDVDDDTPEIGRTAVGAPALEVDETNLAVNSSGNFAALFGVDYGADGPGTTVYAVSAVNGTDSGLVDVATGESILLFNNNGVVEGRVGGADGAVAFTVAVNSSTGVVTLDQLRALDHPNPNDPDDSVSPDSTSIQLSVTATDADGDPVSQTIDIGANLSFDDDGPSVTNAAAGAGVVLDETTAGSPDGFPISATSTGPAITAASTSFGADGAGTITYGLSLQGGAASLPSGLATAIGDFPITLVQVDADTIEGRYNGTSVAFTIEMNDDGTITVTQEVPLEHLVDGSTPAAHDDPLDLGNLVNATITVTDRDGDSASGEVAIGDTIVFRDDGPSVDVTAAADGSVILTTQDAQTIGTNQDSASSTADFSGVFDSIFDGGADGTAGVTGGYTLGLATEGGLSGLTQNGDPIYLYLINGVVVGSTSATELGVTAANTVFDVTAGVDGTVTLTQYSQIDHAPESPSGAPFEDQFATLSDSLVTLTATASITDNDGDTATDSATVNIGANLHFADDGPDIDAALTGTLLKIDETDGVGVPGEVDPLGGNLGTITVASSSLFTITNLHVSADSPTTYSYALDLSAQGVASGLLLSTTDQPIYLYDIGGTVVGSTSTTLEGVNTGNTAFTVSINPDTGAVTLTQFLAVEHYNTASNDEDSSPLTSGVLSATVTATDADGDTDTDSVDLGSIIRFEDDGPAIDVTAAADGGITLTTQDAQTIGADEDSASSTADFSGVFNLTFDGGSDGAANTPDLSYTLGVATQGGNSGLTQGGAPIYLYLINGTVVGSTSATPAGVTAANTVFDVTTDATGVVTLTQYSQIDHPIGSDPTATEAPFDDQLLSLADNLVTLTASATITDNDGDTATDSQTVNIGSNLRFADDGPVAANDGDSIVSGGTSTTGNVITGAGTDTGTTGADDVGADVPGSIVGVTSEGTGESDTTFSGGVLTVDGDFGTLTIDADGNYTYTRDAGTPGTATDVFTYTLRDADGDTSEATLTITISDNAPILATPGPVQLDDDNALGVTGNPGGPGDDAVSGTSGTLTATGGDGDKDFYFATTQTAPAGFTYNLVNASTLQILQGTTVIATVTLNNETGQYTVVQNNPVDHASLDGMTGDNTENNTPNFNIGLVAQDADGDNSPVVNLVINIDDDTPVLSNVTAGAGVTIDETTAGSPAGFPISGTSTSAVITATQAFGADGPAATGSVVYGLDLTGTSNTLATSLQTAQGNYPITLVQIDADTIQGQYNGTNVAFTIQMNANGTVTLTQFVPLEHNVDGSTAAAFDDPLSLAGLVNATITITDGDGDSVTGSAPIGANLIIRDDGPDAQVDGTATLDTLILDESRPEGTDTAGGTAPTGVASVTAQFADNFVGTTDFGADGPGTVTYSFALSATSVGSGLFALDGTDTTTTDGDGCGQGEEILLTRSGNTITGAVGGVTYFTIVLDPATGAVTFTQLEPIFHPVEGDFDETAFLNTDLATDVRVIQTVTDSDGDFDTASVNIGQGVFGIQDDGPSTFDPAAITSGLQNQAGETETALLDVDGDIDANVGEDQPGRITFANIVDGQDSGLTAGGQTIEYFLSADGQTLEARTGGETGTLIFTVTLNQNAEPTDDTYTVTIFQPIDNGAGFVFDDLTSTAAGNVNFRGVGADDPATTVDLLLSASTQAGSSATVNTDNDSIGAANQSVDVGETVRIDFVSNLTSGGTGPTGFDFDSHVSSNQFLGLIPQVQGSQSETVAFTVYALDTTNTDATEPDRDPDNGFSDATVTDITSVTVIGYAATESEPVTADVTGFTVGQFVEVAYGISVRVNADGSVTFSGVQQGDQYGFSTGTETFNAVAVEAEPRGTGGSTAQSFDLGVFSIGVQDNGDPINLSYDLALTDADCDDLIVQDALQITIQPDTDAAAVAAATSQMAANDNGGQQLKTAANSNSVLLGAIAAAGLAATAPAAASAPVAEQQVVESFAVETVAAEPQEFARYEAGGSDLSGLRGLGEAMAAEAVDSRSSSLNALQSDFQASLSGRDAGAGNAQQAQMSQGVEHSQAAAHSPVAEAVAMPSAAMITAALAAEGKGVVGEQVGQAVAEALEGGGRQGDVGAVIAAVTGNGGEEAALAALASSGLDSVPAWDNGSLAAFHNMHNAFTAEAMILHQDAAPQA